MLCLIPRLDDEQIYFVVIGAFVACYTNCHDVDSIKSSLTQIINRGNLINSKGYYDNYQSS